MVWQKPNGRNFNAGAPILPKKTAWFTLSEMQHDVIDRRSLAMAEVIARRISENPRLLDVARANLKRWLATCSPGSKPALLEWEEILQDGLESAVETLRGTDERSTRLRQSSPFAGEEFITRSERMGIIRRFARGAVA